MYQISQGKKISEKPDINQNCDFFQNFLAFFDTYFTKYSHLDIKFEFSDQFPCIKHFISKKFLKMD